MVVAGVHEGKSEICAKVGYFEIGIKLKTERPVPYQLKHALMEVMNNKKYKQNVSRLAEEFRGYDPNALSAAHIERLIGGHELEKRIAA